MKLVYLLMITCVATTLTVYFYFSGEAGYAQMQSALHTVPSLIFGSN